MNAPDATPDELRRLIARLTDGPLTREEAARLNELLRADPMGQETCLEHLELGALLESECSGAAATPAQPPVSLRTEAAGYGKPRRFGGFGQMAAGLALGAFFASAVWAVALPYLSLVRSKLLPLANPDFESSDAPPPDGVPIRPGLWSGDFVKLSGPEAAVSPHSGAQMLRFLRADDAQTPPNAPVRAAELWQVVDLRPLRPTLGEGTATVQLAAWFNSAPHPSRRYTCGVALVAFRGSASEAPTMWRRRHELALAESDKEERLDDDPATWQRVETQVAVPPDAELLLVQVRMYDKSAAPSEGPSLFSAHFADDVSLRVLSPESSVLRPSRPR